MELQRSAKNVRERKKLYQKIDYEILWELEKTNRRTHNQKTLGMPFDLIWC